VEPSEINALHQVDLVGPRYLKRDGRFYSFNVIDVCGHRAKVNAIRSKRDDEIAGSLISTWKTIGIPGYIQLDNEISFFGSPRYPHSLGLVLKLCSLWGIQAIFIPQGEPWWNGVIESFNNTFDKKFIRSQAFRDFSHLVKESKVFENFHNEFHRYSVLRGKLPTSS
jgi:putative transposase